MTPVPPASETLRGLPGPGLQQALWERYVTLLTNGVPSDRILVLADGATRTEWGPKLKALPAPTGGQWIFTPHAFIQQELRLWWALAAEALGQRGLAPQAAAEPVFAAIDLAQYLMASFTAHRRGPVGELLDKAHSAPHFQNVQLLDALARSIEHRQSLDAPPSPESARLAHVRNAQGEPLAAPCLNLAGAIARRLRCGTAAPGLADEAAEAIALYTDGMLRAAVLDHALALEVYTVALWPDPRYQAHLAERFDHLLVEKLDEAPPRLQDLYRAMLASGVCGYFTLQGDGETDSRHPFRGGLREYVGADPEGAWKLAGELTTMFATVTPAAPLAPLGRALLDGLMGHERAISLPPGRVAVRLDDYSPAEMLQAVTERLAELLGRGGVLPRDIALVSPTLSPLVIWSLRQRLDGLGLPLYVFAGTNRLRDYRPVRVLITLGKLGHPDWGLPPTRYELMELVELCTGLNPLKLGKLATRLFPDNQLASPSLVAMAVPELTQQALGRYAALAHWLESWLARPTGDLADFFSQAFARVFAVARGPRTAGGSADEAFLREISQIGQLIELTRRFQTVDTRLPDRDPAGWALRFLAFLDDSPIAERPFFAREPHRNAVMLSTPSQLAEKGFLGADETLRHLFWLDIGSEGWWKRDRRELSNSRVLAHDFTALDYPPEQEQADMNEKLGRVLLANCLKVREKIWIYGCLTDEEGRENHGELPFLLSTVLGPQWSEARGV